MKRAFDEAREKYETIIAPNRLKKSVRRKFKNCNKYMCGKILSGVACASVVFFIFSLNINPVLAKSIAKINSGAEKLVNILTGYKYELEEEYYFAKIEVPKLNSILPAELEEKINAELNENGQKVIDEFKAYKEELESSGLEAHIGVDSGYIIKTENDRVLSFDVYVVNLAGSSSTTHKFYNLDKKKGELITFKSLVKDKENYKEKINEFVKADMEKRNGMEEMFFMDEFKGIKDEPNFYIDDEGYVIIVFDKYEIAPGCMGNPEFKLPKEIAEF